MSDAAIRRVGHLMPFWEPYGVYRGREVHSLAEIDEIEREYQFNVRNQRALDLWRARLARDPLRDCDARLD